MSSTKYKSLEEFFSIICKDVKFDKNLYKQLKSFRLGFVTKNEEHQAFFGDKLLGVHIVRFSSLDDVNLVENIFGLDINFCTKEIYLVKGIVKEHRVASNFIYHLLIYTAHKFAENKSLYKNDNELLDIIKEPILIEEYRMFSGLYAWSFKYPFKKEIAVTALAELSNKYLIKQLDSWEEFFEYRVKDFVGKKSPYYKKMINYSVDDAINIIITLQTKIRSVFKNITRIMYRIKEQEEDVVKSESMFHQDGNMKDHSNGLKPMIEKTKTLYQNKIDFIDSGLISFIEKMFNNLPAGMLEKMLKYLVSDENTKEIKKVESIIEKSIIVNYEYLNRIGVDPLSKSNVFLMISNIKNYWSSSKVNVPDMKHMKKDLYKYSLLATGRKTKWMNVANSIAIVIYIYVLAIKNT